MTESPPKGSRIRRAAQAVVLGAIALGIALVVAEVALRVTGAAPNRGGVFTVTSADFERVPGIFGPHQEAYVSQVPELRYRVRIDSLGYRGADIPRSKPEGTLRILYVGDSFVFGDFVDDDETLPAQTASALAARCVSPVQVINAGLGGSTITEHAEMVERGLSLDPDLVILQFSENDVSDLAGAAMWDELAQNRRLRGRFPLSVVYPLVRNTALWNLALQAVAGIRERRVVRETAAEAPRHPDDADAVRAGVERDRAQYEELLASLRSALASERIPMLFAIMPSHLSVYEHWDSDQPSWLDGLTERLELDSVSFLSTFRGDGRPETELYLLPHDGHASPEGYRIAARELSETLIGLSEVSEHCQ